MPERLVTPVDRLFEAHLTVADMDRSIAFYRERLGLELAHVTPERQAAFFWIGSRGRAMLGLWAAGAGPQKMTQHVALTAALDDVIAAPRRLQAAGIMALDFNGQPTDEPVVLAWMPAAAIYFRDPDGHLLEYIAMLADDARPDGGVVTWREWQLGGVDFTEGDTRAVRVLAISGSLRSSSSNRALVDAAVRLAPAGVEVSIYRQLANLPPFNPDLDTEAPPAAISALRAALQASDAILISSPEYAHGVSGVLKNALDWVVGSGELVEKPIALVNVSTRATHARAALLETLSTMSGRVIREASITIPLDGPAWDADRIEKDARLSAMLSSALDALACAARAARVD